MSEGLEYNSVVTPLLKWLNSLPNCKAINTHGSVFFERGTPDVLGSIQGRMFVFECKRDGKEDRGKPSKIQEFRVAQWKAAGAISAAIWSVDEAKQIMRDAGVI